MSTHIDLSPNECALLYRAFEAAPHTVMDELFDHRERGVGVLRLDISDAGSTVWLHVGDGDEQVRVAQWVGGPHPEMANSINNAVNATADTAAEAVVEPREADAPRKPQVTYAFTIENQRSKHALMVEARRRCEMFYDVPFTITTIDVTSTTGTSYSASVWAQSA